MKQYIFIFYLMFITGCFYKSPILVDVEAPVLSEIFYYEEQLIFQFDEPVKEFNMSFPDEKTLNIINEIPLANNYIMQSVFSSYQSVSGNNNQCSYLAIDTSDNKTTGEFVIPQVNLNPADLSLTHIRLKTSSKFKQVIGIKSKNGGDLRGAVIKLFSNREMHIIPFSPDNIKKNSKFEIVLGYNKQITDAPMIVKESGNVFALTLPYRLPQKFGIIAIYDFKGNLLDYIVYYDSKDRPFVEYLNGVYYRKLASFIEDSQLNPVYSDIAGNTSTKIPVKIDECKFIVRKCY